MLTRTEFISYSICTLGPTVGAAVSRITDNEALHKMNAEARSFKRFSTKDSKIILFVPSRDASASIHLSSWPTRKHLGLTSRLHPDILMFELPDDLRFDNLPTKLYAHLPDLNAAKPKRGYDLVHCCAASLESVVASLHFSNILNFFSIVGATASSVDDHITRVSFFTTHDSINVLIEPTAAGSMFTTKKHLHATRILNKDLPLWEGIIALSRGIEAQSTLRRFYDHVD
jgi:hypothetical protein